MIVTIELPNKRNWSEITNCTCVNDFYEKVQEISPRDYVLNLEKLEYFVDKKLKNKKVNYVSPYDENSWIVPEPLGEWCLNELLGDHDRKKTLVLIGPTRLGKTEFARSLGKHMYFNAIANFKDDWDDEAEYIIFDDFGWDFIPARKSFFGGQKEFQITGKYMRVKTVKWGKACIYLTNEMPQIKQEEMDWYNANCTFIRVDKKMY